MVKWQSDCEPRSLCVTPAQVPARAAHAWVRVREGVHACTRGKGVVSAGGWAGGQAHAGGRARIRTRPVSSGTDVSKLLISLRMAGMWYRHCSTCSQARQVSDYHAMMQSPRPKAPVQQSHGKSWGQNVRTLQAKSAPGRLRKSAPGRLRTELR